MHTSDSLALYTIRRAHLVLNSQNLMKYSVKYQSSMHWILEYQIPNKVFSIGFGPGMTVISILRANTQQNKVPLFRKPIFLTKKMRSILRELERIFN